MTIVSDVALSQRLERAEAYACREFAASHLRLKPNCGSAWLDLGGAVAVFDGVDSPITQSFGLGVLTPLTAQSLDQIEAFFLERHAPVYHEVSPLAGVEAVRLLCDRGYRPVELSSVMYQPVSVPDMPPVPGVRARVAGPEDMALWADVSTRGWISELPDAGEFLREMGRIQAARTDLICFLGEIGGQAGASGSLTVHDGVALFSGSATAPEMRRLGLQSALLRERMRVAAGRGCDLAMMVALAGSGSQRNAERNGFRIAYTRTKWQLTTG